MLENVERELLMFEIEEELAKKGSGGPRPRPHNGENKLRDDLEEDLKKKGSGGPRQHG